MEVDLQFFQFRNLTNANLLYLFFALVEDVNFAKFSLFRESVFECVVGTVKDVDFVEVEEVSWEIVNYLRSSVIEGVRGVKKIFIRLTSGVNGFN